jgi:large subunit ribosomal protein L6
MYGKSNLDLSANFACGSKFEFGFEMGIMSRIGRMPIALPKGVKVSSDSAKVEVSGPKGHLVHTLAQGISITQEAEKVLVHRVDDQRSSRALQGLTRSLLANMVTGVIQGFEKRLEVIGIGYRADVQGKALKISLGFSHPVLFPIPEGIKVEVEKQTLITIKGIDKQQVGIVAANSVPSNPRNLIKGRESVMPGNGSGKRSERLKLRT